MKKQAIPIINLFNLPNPILAEPDAELFEPIIKTHQILIERIISNGHKTPPEYWYEQTNDEWVALLSGQATLMFDEEEGETLHLKAGDAILIPAMRPHRVIYTSSDPPCIWLAIHGKLT